MKIELTDARLLDMARNEYGIEGELFGEGDIVSFARAAIAAAHRVAYCARPAARGRVARCRLRCARTRRQPRSRARERAFVPERRRPAGLGVVCGSSTRRLRIARSAFRL